VHQNKAKLTPRDIHTNSAQLGCSEKAASGQSIVCAKGFQYWEQVMRTRKLSKLVIE
jgi:hypothetical protein